MIETMSGGEDNAKNAKDPNGFDASLDFDHQHLQSRLDVIRQYVSRPIPQQPWDDSTPALIPFHDEEVRSNGENGGTHDNACNTSNARNHSTNNTDDGNGTCGGGGIIIGSARHAANIPLLKSFNVIAVLNCASGGIARLPVDELKECGIRYAFTNCRQDSYSYPILHEKKKKRRIANNEDARSRDWAERKNGNDANDAKEQFICSQHLEISNSLFADIRRQNNAARRDTRDTTNHARPAPAGNVLFFCVAGQNRSAALAVATLLLHGKPLEDTLRHCAKQRPFILENVGFQRQIVELEAILNRLTAKNAEPVSAGVISQYPSHWKLLQYAVEASEVPEQYFKRVRMMDDYGEKDVEVVSLPSAPLQLLSSKHRTKSEADVMAGTKVEIELLIPGLCTMEVRIPVQCTIATLKRCLIRHANENLLLYDERPAKVAKAWVVLAKFGHDDMYDIPLENEAVELKVQLERMESMFGLTSVLKDGEPHVMWNERCRFALVIFSVTRIQRKSSSRSISDSNNSLNSMDIDTDSDGDEDLSLRPDQEPWTFVHEERPNAPATLLENTLRSTHLRAWDFATGESLASKTPLVFSFADDPRDRRAFMMVSRSANTMQQFHFPGEGDILGMGMNAIVHRVQLRFTESDGSHRDEGWTEVNVGLQNDQVSDINPTVVSETPREEWDAAVKRPFSLSKMLVFLQNSSEAGLAKRIRLANLLNSDGRVLYFYGLGLGLSTNAYNQNQYKFELMLLSKYEEEFSTYTMQRFMKEYVGKVDSVTEEEQRLELQKLQSGFSITSVKVLLVSLLNALRDLTLMGVQGFDLNLKNVLVSRDYRNVRLIDIDGNAQGSVKYPTIESIANDTLSPSPKCPHKPCIDVDLNILLPSVIEQLLLGKGRGLSFVSNKRSEIWRAKEDYGKEMIQTILMENFYPVHEGQRTDSEIIGKSRTHTAKVAEWFYALLKKQSPWNNWTNDIVSAF